MEEGDNDDEEGENKEEESNDDEDDDDDDRYKAARKELEDMDSSGMDENDEATYRVSTSRHTKEEVAKRPAMWGTLQARVREAGDRHLMEKI